MKITADSQLRLDFISQVRRPQMDAQSKLWEVLRDRRFLGLEFKQQYPVAGFIADFCCEAQDLIIEIDDGRHLEKETEEDFNRSLLLRRKGYRIIRLWDQDVLNNFEEVLNLIYVRVAPSFLTKEMAG